MNITATREQLLDPLQLVSGVVERRQTMPVLANTMMQVTNNRLLFTTTDTEVTLSASQALIDTSDGATTVPARKLLDILKALPEGQMLTLDVVKGKAVLKAGRSRYQLQSLPASEFPVAEDLIAKSHFECSQTGLRKLLESTQFAMANQDVRFYLNGLLLDFHDQSLRAVATDGHRLAMNVIALEKPVEKAVQLIIPRKGVLELQRLLGDGEETVQISVGPGHFRAEIGHRSLVSKLVDGKFPDFQRVMPAESDTPVVVDRQTLRTTLSRASILANDKYRGIRLTMDNCLLKIQAHNPEQEEADEEVEVSYSGKPLEMGFNVNYLLDALGALEGELVELHIQDSASSCLLLEPGDSNARYVVMPMRL